MAELICHNGHVIDEGKELCSRCNAGVETPIEDEEVLGEGEIDSPEEDQPPMGAESSEISDPNLPPSEGDEDPIIE